jgi:hypothetical protein
LFDGVTLQESSECNYFCIVLCEGEGFATTGWEGLGEGVVALNARISGKMATPACSSAVAIAASD